MEYPNAWNQLDPERKEANLKWFRQGPLLFENQINWTVAKKNKIHGFYFYKFITPNIIELHNNQKSWLQKLVEIRKDISWHYIYNNPQANYELATLYVPHKNEYLTAIQRQTIEKEIELSEAHYQVQLIREKRLHNEKRVRIEKLANEILAAENPRRRKAPPRTNSQNQLRKIREFLRKDCD